MKRLAILLFLMSTLAVSAFAKDTTRVAYLPSKFGDNWTLQVGGGVNMVFNNRFGPVGPAAELRVGKWFTPAVGVRVGAIGYKNRPNGTETGWFSGRNDFYFGHASVDVMWNLLNTFNYNEHRFWDIVPYVRGGAIMTKQHDAPAHFEPGFGVGIHNGLRLGKRVDLYLEASAVGAREKAYRERGTIAVFPSFTAGLVFKLGKVGFDRPTPVTIKETELKEIVRTDTVTVVKEIVNQEIIDRMKEEPQTLYFDLDVTVLTQRELDHLERWAHYVLTPDSVVLLVGSADKETGNPAHNQWLSEQRNAHVREILIKVYGLKRENIQEIANGDRKNEFRTPEQNRCVTISFVK